MAPAGANKNADIEVLRALAIVFTLLAHLKQALPWPMPLLRQIDAHLSFWTGVDLFFVVSGYVISQSILRELRARPPGSAGAKWIGIFWIRRVFRLLPGAWLWIATAMTLSFFLPREAGFAAFDPIKKYAFIAFFQIANFGSAYLFGAEGVNFVLANPLSHYWSLSTEEQFYLVLPLCMFLIPRNALIFFVLACIALQFNFNRVIFSLGWYTRVDALMWGVLLGLCFEKDFYQQIRQRLLAIRWGGVPMFCLLAFLLARLPNELCGYASGRAPVSYAIGLIALVSALLVFFASFDENLFLRPGGVKRFIVGIGARSYSLYLSHLVIFLAVAAMYRASPWVKAEFCAAHAFVLLFISLGLSFLCAEMTYRWVEVPLREYGRRLTQRM